MQRGETVTIERVTKAVSWIVVIAGVVAFTIAGIAAIVLLF